MNYADTANMSSSELLVAQQVETCRIRCPECSDDRKKSHEKPLQITVEPEKTLYDCHHCGWHGAIFKDNGYKPPTKPPKVVNLPTQLNQTDKHVKAFFANRGITIPDPSKLPVTTGTKWFQAMQRETEAIGFVYGPKDMPEAIKWRPLDGTKTFTQDGAARSFYGVDMLPENSKEVIIVEGEADVIAMAAVGIQAISVPNGAPMKVSSYGVDPSEDRKFAFVWEARELLEHAERIVLAVDNDSAGNALVEELCRRIGRGKCYRTEFPDGLKDPTDVLVHKGEEALRKSLEESKPVPLEGIYSPTEYMSEVEDYYLHGHGKGEPTGLANIDRLFTIAPGLYVVTGHPGMGKSEFVDQLMINLAMRRQWKWAVASFENPPAIHSIKLAEKFIGKPFYDGVTPKMGRHEVNESMAFIDQHFVFLQNKDGSLPTIDSVIARTKSAIQRLGCRGLVIDPFNYIQQNGSDSETKQISDMLTKITAFANAYKVAVFFIAHPAKMYPDQSGNMPIPTGHSVSGSAAWFAKADVGITVHRSTAGVEIHCWKVRFKWIGQMGTEFLDYDVPTGRYFVPADLKTRHEGSHKETGFMKSSASMKAELDHIDLNDLDF